MNYIEQINFFWAKHREHSLGDTDIATYFNLLKHSNASSWKNPVLIRNSTFLDELMLKDLRTLQNSRNKLQQFGLITFTQRERDPFCTYKIVAAGALNAARHAPRHVARHAAGDAPEDAAPILIDKQKPKPKQKSRELDDFEIIYPFSSERFMQKWEVWLNYKQVQHSFRYKSKVSLQAALKELGELSSNDETTAIAIIEQAIAKGWKGLFALKNQNLQQNGFKTGKTGGDQLVNVGRTAEAILAEAAREERARSDQQQQSNTC